MNKKFLYINTFLVFFVAVLYFIFSSKLSNDTKSSLVNLQKYYQEQQINIWEATFEEASISSLKSFDLRNLRIGFDYPLNNFKLKLSLQIDNITISFSDFSAKELKLRANNIRLHYLNSGTINNSNWISENYPFVGLDSGNFEVVFVNDQQDIRKTIESNLKEFLKLFKLGSTALKFDFTGRLRFNDNSPLEVDLKVIQKEANYLLQVDFSKFVPTTKHIKLTEMNSVLFGDYLFNAYLLDLEQHIANVVDITSEDKTNFPKDAYSQVLSGFLLKLYFKESFINKFLESKLQANEINSPALKEMYINNFKIGTTYADSGVEEDELKKILFEDKQIRLRPSNFSIKIK